tara:strand:- start:9411 stop:10352 length:942 start_codon:yes stop_codon:yes gene_type:complete
MNILITGITGHIGCALAKTLSLSNKVYGTYNKKISSTLKKELSKKNITIISLNLLNQKKIEKFIRIKKINCCIHAAAVSHEIYVKENMQNTLDINCNTVFNFLEIQKSIKFKFMLISTGSVFQDIGKLKKIPESITPSPISLYAGSKRLGEILVDSYRKYFNSNSCIVRLSWVYGPPIITNELNIQRGPIPNILYQIIKNKKILFILNSGKNFKASFTYIDDVTNSIYKLISMKKFNKSSYHLGSGKNNTLAELFNEIKKKFPKVRFKLGSGAKPWSNDSIMRPPLASEYNLKTKINLKEGLEKYSNWLKENA